MRKSLALLLMGALTMGGTAFAALPRTSAVPGGVVVVDLGEAAGPAPTARWQDRPVLVIADAGHFKAVVGVALERVQGPGPQPHHQTRRLWVLRPQAVEPPLRVLVPRRGRPVQEVAAVGPETSDLQTFHILPVGSEELSLPWRCGVDKMRSRPAGKCWRGTNRRPLFQPRRRHRVALTL